MWRTASYPPCNISPMFERLQFDAWEREHFLVNGEVVDEGGFPHAIRNRAFLYADGFFETIRVAHGVPQHLDLHFGRIQDSCRAYQLEAPEHWNVEWLRERLLALCAANGILEGGRIRLTFYRDGGGRYTPENDHLFWVGEGHPISDNAFKLNEQGLKVDIYPDMKKMPNHLANFKNLSSTLYVQSALWARARQFDEALIQNTSNHIIESTRSNLFLVSNRVLYTSSLSGGPTGGVMRAAVARLAAANGFKVYEYDLSPQELLRADEMFLTNAVRGIQWVSSYRTKRYFSSTAQQLTSLLNDSLEQRSA